MTGTELGRIQTSMGRRVLGVGALMGLGALVVYMGAATQTMPMGYRVFLVVFGAFALWGSQIMWRSTAHDLVLTDEALWDSDGTLVARLDNIAKVDRSTFAMKPSNGFLLLLKEKDARVWRPGIWWRSGRKVAIGGVTAGSQTKPIADIIAAKLAGD